jgi:lysophospholipase L1-like esterase
VIKNGSADMKKVVVIQVISLVVLCLFTAIFQIQLQKKTVDTLTELKETEMKTEAKTETKDQFRTDRKVVVLLGSSVTQGMGASEPQKSWAGLLNEYLLKQEPDVIFLNLGVGGFTTKDIVKSSLKITANLNAENLTPDIIIFENCLINDFLNLSTSETKKNIQAAVTRLRNQFPKAQIYLTPPNNVTVYSNRVNAEGFSYQDYVKEIGDYSTTKDWNYINFWDTFESDAAKRNVDLEDTLGHDGKHPNDTGYDIWFEALKKHIDFTDL